MERAETAALVGKVAAIDGRQITDEVVTAWHDVIGHLSFVVADRATKYALQNPNAIRVEPKHVFAEVRRAIIDINAELNPVEDEDGEYTDRPVNYQEMEDFYRELWLVSPWVFQVPSGKSAKGNPVYRQLYGDELRVELEKAARRVGRVLPEPVFAEEPF